MLRNPSPASPGTTTLILLLAGNIIYSLTLLPSISLSFRRRLTDFLARVLAVLMF